MRMLPPVLTAPGPAIHATIPRAALTRAHRYPQARGRNQPGHDEASPFTLEHTRDFVLMRSPRRGGSPGCWSMDLA
jgi:hypothetical protein